MLRHHSSLSDHSNTVLPHISFLSLIIPAHHFYRHDPLFRPIAVASPGQITCLPHHWMFLSSVSGIRSLLYRCLPPPPPPVPKFAHRGGEGRGDPCCSRRDNQHTGDDAVVIQ